MCFPGAILQTLIFIGICVIKICKGKEVIYELSKNAVKNVSIRLKCEYETELFLFMPAMKRFSFKAELRGRYRDYPQAPCPHA